MKVLKTTSRKAYHGYQMRFLQQLKQPKISSNEEKGTRNETQQLLEEFQVRTSFRTKSHLTEAAEESRDRMKYKIESTSTTDIDRIGKKTGLQFGYDPLRRENFSERGEINVEKSIKKNVTESISPNTVIAKESSMKIPKTKSKKTYLEHRRHF